MVAVGTRISPRPHRTFGIDGKQYVGDYNPHRLSDLSLNC